MARGAQNRGVFFRGRKGPSRVEAPRVGADIESSSPPNSRATYAAQPHQLPGRVGQAGSRSTLASVSERSSARPHAATCASSSGRLALGARLLEAPGARSPWILCDHFATHATHATHANACVAATHTAHAPAQRLPRLPLLRRALCGQPARKPARERTVISTEHLDLDSAP